MTAVTQFKLKEPTIETYLSAVITDDKIAVSPQLIMDEAFLLTASKVVVGIDRATILSLYQSAVSNETKYWRLRLSCCNKLVTISQLPSSS